MADIEIEIDTKQKHKREIIIIRETTRESIIHDGVSALAVILIIGVGVVVGSAAMQWVGFILVCIAGLALAAGRQSKIMTLAEARNRLDEIEREG